MMPEPKTRVQLDPGDDDRGPGVLLKVPLAPTVRLELAEAHILSDQLLARVAEGLAMLRGE